jgi:hypothetical protein
MNQAILWLILLQPMLENKAQELNTCVHKLAQKSAVVSEVKSCAEKQRLIKGTQQAILNLPQCELKPVKRSVCA